MIEPGRIPRNVHEKAERLLAFVSKRTSYYSETVEIGHSQMAIAFALNQHELIALAGLLQDEGLARLTNDPSARIMRIKLTAEGLERAAIQENTGRHSKRAFVAMWFTDEMDDVFETAIKPAARAADFDAFRIVDERHNNDINAEIIAAIRRSRFVIADLTGQRGGVYFEAGFAMGLGIPVIWSCRKNWFNTEVQTRTLVTVNGLDIEAEVKENRRTHFDVEHFPFLIWENAAELHKKLKNQIQATIEP
jgi:nucleoside 2-deoxyribosyltransferase